MLYNVLLTRQPNSLYTARVLSVPDLVVSGTDDTEVLARVRAAIAHIQANNRLVQVEAPPLTETLDDPWLCYAGMWGNDPDWDLYQSEIRSFRTAIDSEIVSA